MPSNSGSAFTAISTAAPELKPNRAAGEMKLASVPKRRAPIDHCITPTMTVTAKAIWMYAGLKAAASGESMANSASELALVGPDMTCQLEPNKAAMTQGTMAV